MTLVRNRADRIEARRKGALSRIEESLRTDVRFVARTGPVSYDAAQRSRALAEADALALKLAKPAAKQITRKSRTFAPWTAARTAHRSGKLA